MNRKGNDKPRIRPELARLPFDPWQRALGEARIDEETAHGYKATAGLASRFSALWAARTDHYRREYEDGDDASLRLAALNDLCRDTSEVGTHARRVRAQWLKDSHAFRDAHGRPPRMAPGEVDALLADGRERRGF